MERIEPIRRDGGTPWVAPTAPAGPVQRRQGDAQQQQRKQQQGGRRPQPYTPDGHPDADGHVDVEA